MRKWTEILDDLAQPLDISRVKSRDAGGTSIPYLEGADVINTANRIFNEDGWDAYPLGPVERFEVGTRQNNSKTIVVCVYTVPYMVRFHGLLEDGTIHTIEKGDIGKNSTQSEAYQQHEMAISGCATDALKRAMRHLGQQFGLTLYDKESEDFQQAVGSKPAPVKKPASEKKSAPAKPATKPAPEKKSAIQRALDYVIPESLEVEGKPVRVPNSGKTLGEILDDPMGIFLMTWLAGLRNSPAGTPPFVAMSEQEHALQNAVGYVLLNKKLEEINEEETDILKQRLSK